MIPDHQVEGARKAVTGVIRVLARPAKGLAHSRHFLVDFPTGLITMLAE